MKHLQIFLKGVGYAEFQNEKKFILLAHSQGGLYAQQFARTYPDMFGGIVFVDPLSANDNRYKKVFLNELTKVSLHDSCLEEYRLAHDESEICQLKEKGDFPQIPIVLITHGSEFEIKEIMEFGQTTKEFATKVEEFWQSLMQEYLTFSEQSILLRANNSGHYIHLTDFEVIMQALSRYF